MARAGLEPAIIPWWWNMSPGCITSLVSILDSCGHLVKLINGDKSSLLFVPSIVRDVNYDRHQVFAIRASELMVVLAFPSVRVPALEECHGRFPIVLLG